MPRVLVPAKRAPRRRSSGSSRRAGPRQRKRLPRAPRNRQRPRRQPVPSSRPRAQKPEPRFGARPRSTLPSAASSAPGAAAPARRHHQHTAHAACPLPAPHNSRARSATAIPHRTATSQHPSRTRSAQISVLATAFSRPRASAPRRTLFRTPCVRAGKRDRTATQVQTTTLLKPRGRSAARCAPYMQLQARPPCSPYTGLTPCPRPARACRCWTGVGGRGGRGCGGRGLRVLVRGRVGSRPGARGRRLCMKRVCWALGVGAGCCFLEPCGAGAA